MWEAIDDITPDEDIAAYSGDLLLVFIASHCEINRKVRERIERRAVAMSGDRDLKFAFAPSATHDYHHGVFGIAPDDLPAAVYLQDGREKDRASSIDDVLELVGELVLRYR